MTPEDSRYAKSHEYVHVEGEVAARVVKTPFYKRAK